MSEIDWMHEASQLNGELVDFRRELHLEPELSLEEAKTAAKVTARLEALGIEITKRQIGGHGFIAEIDSGVPGKTIALRADMDALPIMEETGLPFASKNPGVMHACGHDAHTSILLGAATLLQKHSAALKGRIRFIFQSAEETLDGGKAMVEAGALEGVDEIYGLHNQPNLSAGKVANRFGSLMGSVARLEITIKGQGGHGAIPERSVDPIVCSSAIIQGLQSTVSREVSPFSPVVVTIGSMHAGDANNVIPPKAELTGTVRTFDPEVQATMGTRLKRIITGIAESYRCEAEVVYREQVPVLVNHDGHVEVVKQAAYRCVGKANYHNAEPTLAGEDFALYVQKIPGSFFWLGSGPQTNAEQNYGLHHPKFTIDESCLPVGAAMLASIAWDRSQS